MNNQNNQDITKKVVQHLATKKWTKKNFVSLAGIVAVALVGKYTGINLNNNQNIQNNQNISSGKITKGSTYQAKVIKIADGDTATVVDGNGAQHKIRFAYIDAPESKQANGIASKNALNQLISDKNVQIYVTDVDRYQREVSVVSVNGLDVNYEQVKNGNAWHYQAYAKKNQPSSDYQKYDLAQKNAENQRIGLWSGKKPQAPWEYRAEQRALKNTSIQTSQNQNNQNNQNNNDEIDEE